ncbi:MAG: class I SAM-dependent methyltransferase [Candidatus Aenigmarchaeota archaeon]|nr:class I SAM-dependent methyltransferase [Candidatus Aenigmarchaeota archaeon]
MNMRTDSLTDQRFGRVFPIFEDESAYFAKNIQVDRRADVLDIGTGSGILAIAAAQEGAEVVAVDRNPRAISFAMRNAARNRVRSKIRFLLGDGLEPVAGMFDLITCNPPFNITPPGQKGALFSDGGPDGLRLARRILRQAPRHLRPAGKLQMIVMSPGTGERPAVMDMVRRHFPHAMVECTSLFPPTPLRPILQATLKGRYPAFVRDLCSRYTTYFYLFITIHSGRRREVRWLPTPSFRRSRYAGSWEGRVRRRRVILGYARR